MRATDADGLLEHAHNVAEAREKLFREFACDDLNLSGEPAPTLAALIPLSPGNSANPTSRPEATLRD